MNTIPHNQPYLEKDEILAVKNVIQRRWLAEGIEVDRLEKQFLKLLKRRYAVAVNSGSSALHICLLALGVRSRDEVILPTYTCTALLNAISYVGATPILVDSEQAGVNLDISEVTKHMTKRTRAIIVPHTFGLPANIAALHNLAVPIIEDCAVALGSSYLGKPLGSFGTLAVFSFGATKMIAGGQGGMVVSDRRDLDETIRDLIHYDKRRDFKVRYHYTMNDLTAAVVNVQFGRHFSFVKRRRSIARRYISVLSKRRTLSFFPQERDLPQVNAYRFIILFENRARRDRVQRGLKEKDITAIIPLAGYQLLHRYLKFSLRDYPRAEVLAETALSLPIYPALTDVQVNHIVNALVSLL